MIVIGQKAPLCESNVKCRRSGDGTARIWQLPPKRDKKKRALSEDLPEDKGEAEDDEDDEDVDDESDGEDDSESNRSSLGHIYFNWLLRLLDLSLTNTLFLSCIVRHNVVVQAKMRLWLAGEGLELVGRKTRMPN